MFISEIFAQICSFEYADHHELICFGQKGPDDTFFNRPNPRFDTKPCPGQQRRLLSDWSVQSGISLVNPLKSKHRKETDRFVTRR